MNVQTPPTKSLEELQQSALAQFRNTTPGDWWADGDTFRVVSSPPGSNFIGDERLIALCATGDGAHANSGFIAAAHAYFAALSQKGELTLSPRARIERDGLTQYELRLMILMRRKGQDLYEVGDFFESTQWPARVLRTLLDGLTDAGLVRRSRGRPPRYGISPAGADYLDKLGVVT